MLQLILGLQSFYETLYTENAALFIEWAALYGWFATASLTVALVTLPFVFLRREQVRTFAILIGQHVIVIGIPWLIQPISDLISGFGG